MPYSDAPRTLAGSMVDGTTIGSYGTYALDLLESVPAIAYPESVITYSRMRHDPQIKAVIDAYAHPIRAGTWAVNPKGCRDEVVQLVADAWGLPVLGQDDGPGPFRRRGVRWAQHLRLTLALTLAFGHCPYAVRYEITGDPIRARLAELSERLPQTISSIEINPDGSLKGVYQNGGRDLIPAKNLLWYCREREGAAWQGQSMLRPAYAPWLIKHELWRILATSSRRFGMGVPQVKAPAGGTPSDIAKAAEIAALYRVGDQSGIGLPDGYTFDLTGLSGSVPDTLGFIHYLDAQIATSCLAELLNLDTSPNGSRALGDTVISLLELAWQATADEIAETASTLNVQMVDFNFGEDEPVPGVVCTDINRPEVTSEAVSALVACGAMTPDLSLENAMRERYRLPLVDHRPLAADSTAKSGQVSQAPQNSPGGTGGPVEVGPAAAQPPAEKVPA